MFEDVTKPPEKSSMFLWRFPPWFYAPEDSFEASWNARLFSGIGFLVLALQVWGDRGAGVWMIARDGAALVLFALVWKSRNSVFAALATATSPLFLFGAAGPTGSKVDWSGAGAVFASGLCATWACVTYAKFRKAEDAPPSPEAANAPKPS